MTRRNHAFFLRVAHSLGACQLVEFELKLYIQQAFELVEKYVKGRLSFKMSGADYENAPLEQLIKTFKKLSDNPPLVSRLERFKNERNFVAHKAIAACLDPEGGLQQTAAAALKGRLEEIAKEAALLTEAIHEESMKFIPHLYFDPLDKD
jgi:hypothetical protein